MRGRKTPAAKKKPAASNRSAKSKSTNDRHHRLQAQLKKSNDSRKELQKKLSNSTLEWKDKIKQVEHEAFEKARVAFEKEFLKKEEARQKAIALAIAKFEKQYTKTTGRKKPSAKKSRRPSQAARSRSHAQGNARRKAAV